MNEKREFPRYSCKFPVKFKFYEGNPDEIEIASSSPVKGKGTIIDISKGGTFLVSNSRVNINIPIILTFSSGGKKNNLSGIIVRTGLLKNNPSEVAQRYAGQKVKGDAYIAVKFDTPMENIIQ
ncbi:MAG: PilZ domain-containing protein [Spirochaetes bacterium]|nr:PilZ domain-containing protein [Spirochaetota bacterium]